MNTDEYKISLRGEHVEYYLTDINKKLRGSKVEVFFRWEQMAVVGFYYQGKVKVGEFTVPKKYVGERQRKYSPGPMGRKHNY